MLYYYPLKKIFFKTFTLLIFFIFPVLVFAWDSHLKALAERFALNSDNFTQEDQAYLYAHNTEINYMAKKGIIHEEVYQVNQAFYQIKTKELIENAARNIGLTVETLQALSLPKPGADFDAIISKPFGSITLQDAKNMRRSVNREIRNYLLSNGQQDCHSFVDWSSQLNIDAMPNPDQTTQFEIINKWINENGGTAYTSFEAARTEMLIRVGRANEITTTLAAAYHKEMKIQIDCKLKTIAINESLLEELRQNKMKNGFHSAAETNEFHYLQAQLEILNAQVAKYLMRKIMINDTLASNHQLKNPIPHPYEEDIKKAASRNSDFNGLAVEVRKNAELFALLADDNFIEINIILQFGYRRDLSVCRHG